MTNEEKARELMKEGDVFTRGDVYAFVDEVARWKDERHMVFLQRLVLKTREPAVLELLRREINELKNQSNEE